MHNLAVNLERSAALFPDKTALRMGAEEISYQQLESAASTVAHNLKQLGWNKGTKWRFRVLMLPTSPSLITEF